MTGKQVLEDLKRQYPDEGASFKLGALAVKYEVIKGAYLRPSRIVIDDNDSLSFSSNTLKIHEKVAGQWKVKATLRLESHHQHKKLLRLLIEDWLGEDEVGDWSCLDLSSLDY